MPFPLLLPLLAANMATHISNNGTSEAPEGDPGYLGARVTDFARNVEGNKYTLLFITMLYPVMVFYLERYMRRRPPMNIRGRMIAWNAALSYISFHCARNMLPPLVRAWPEVHSTLCQRPVAMVCGTRECLEWARVFVLCKHPEMIDTVWIILRKRKLTVLQVWHHFSVAIYCGILIIQIQYSNGAHGLVFGAMNSVVHTVMYGYYAIVTATPFRSAMIAQSITIMQIAQMVIGLTVHLFRLLQCQQVDWPELWAGNIIYGSYLYLFLVYYIARYRKPKVLKSE